MKKIHYTLRIFIFFAFLLILGLELSAIEIPLPADIKIILPQKSSIKVEWIVPPLNKKLPKETKEYQSLAFDVDYKGEPWFIVNRKILINPLRKTLFEVDNKLIDFVFLDTGEAIALIEEAIGFLSEIPNNSYKLQFVPVIKNPYRNSKLISGKGETLYLISKNNIEGINQVYILKSQKDKGIVQKLFETKEEINSICGEEEKVYVAIKNVILMINFIKGEINFLIKHKYPITDIKCSPKGKIFFATSSSIGVYDGRLAVDFIGISNPKIRLRNDSLYVLLPENLGVFRISDVDNLNFTPVNARGFQ
ncbi:MAG: hypothetical protein ABIM83_07990 [candidate division WOR-3 bacterium]